MVNGYEIGWSPSIGDPTFTGWLTVVCYLFCSFFCWQVYRQGQTIFVEPVTRQKILWLALFVMTLFLGVNKQLDLQSLFTEIGKYFALEHDWYDSRRRYQLGFITALIVFSILACCVLLYAFFEVLRTHAFAIVGLAVLLVFIVLRASPFHHVDLGLAAGYLGLNVNVLLELSGIAMIIGNALYLRKQMER